MESMLGGARITYLGHSTFRFTTAGGEQIIIDPFLTDNPQTPEELKRVGELDTILITHGHFDHFSDALPVQGQTGAKTVSNFEIFAYLQRQGVENAMPIQKGGTIEVGGLFDTLERGCRQHGAEHLFLSQPVSGSYTTEEGRLEEVATAQPIFPYDIAACEQIGLLFARLDVGVHVL